MIGTGVDKARGGWVAVTIGDEGFVRATFVERLEDLEAGGVSWVAIDMPMAFPSEGRRVAEVAARRMLGSRASTVFLTPPRSAVERDWDHARRCGVSKQFWNLVPAILEVERCRAPNWIEVHPEVAFASLAGKALPSKKTWGGLAARRALLAANGVTVPDELGSAGTAAPDDVLDATVCAVVASRHPAGTRRLGERGEAIWTLAHGSEG